MEREETRPRGKGITEAANGQERSEKRAPRTTITPEVYQVAEQQAGKARCTRQILKRIPERGGPGASARKGRREHRRSERGNGGDQKTGEGPGGWDQAVPPGQKEGLGLCKGGGGKPAEG